jgi:HPr kinase/phosphorylase
VKPKLTIRELVAQKKEVLQLEVVAGSGGLDRVIKVPEISSPGLVLSGYTERFLSERLHVLGETEVHYLTSLDPDERRSAVEPLLGPTVPCVFVTKGQTVPDDVLAGAETANVPVITSSLKTSEFYRRLSPYLSEVFAPSTTIHGSLADVYGVGLLFVGRSGIGKSECVLDLVERGHRLVADDAVSVSRRGADVLIGRANDLAQQYMEIRGVGIVDISAMFGVRAVRQQKRIEVIVQLDDWDTTGPQERTGLDIQKTSILDVEIPQVIVPLNPGKNITVISEVVAMHHLLRYAGVDPAKTLNDRLIAQMESQKQLREYLTEDYE